MLKKSLIVLLVVGGVAFLVPGMPYHVGRAFDWARDEVADAVPIAYQLEEAEQFIEELAPEIQEAREQVVIEEVEIEELAAAIARNEERLGREAVALKGRAEALKEGETVLAVAGRTYSRSALAHNVQYALERHQRRSALLEGQRQTLDARTRRLEASRERLERMVCERDRLVLTVEQLKAKLRENEALEAARGTEVVESTRLTELARTLKEIDKRLKVQRRLIEESDPILGKMDHNSVDPDEVAASVDAWFSGKGEVEETLVPTDSGR